MAKSKKQLHEELRALYLKQITDFLTAQGEEVLRTKSNEICIPCTDSENNDEFVQIVVKVPTGSKDEGYDGYAEAENYELESRQKAEKAEKAKAVKDKKIAKDKAQREARAKAKAEHEAKKGEGE